MTRAAAKIARKAHPENISIFRCPECDYFHLGHLPKAVKNGHYTRGEWYGD